MGGGDSKLGFASHMRDLVDKPIAPDDHQFFSIIFLSRMSAADVFALVQPQHIRDLKSNQPKNLAVLMYKCLEQLYMFLSAKESLKPDSATTSLRILTRILPFVFERDPEGQKKEVTAVEAGQPLPSETAADNFEEEFFWHNKVGSYKFDTFCDEPVQQPLGRILVQTLVRICFVNGFTIPAEGNFTMEQCKPITTHQNLDQRLLWENGLAATGLSTHSNLKLLDGNRIDVLKCLLSCFTGSLYQRESLVVNRFIHEFAEPSNPYTYCLFYSIINCVLMYEPAGSLPYTSYFTDQREYLLDIGLHVLLIGLDYSSFVPFYPQPNSMGSSATVPRQAYMQHALWRAMVELHTPQDFKFLFEGFLRLLSNHLRAANTLLPSSQKLIECHSELLLLLWKILGANPEFRTYVCQRKEVTELVVALCYFLSEAHQSPSAFGLLYITTFILLMLSGERDCAVALNQRFTQSVPMKLPLFSGNHVDLLVLIFHQLFAAKKPWIRSLYNCLLTILCNLSPYTKSLTQVASLKLVGLFEAFTRPKHLEQADQANIANVILVVEIFNNIIQYQYEGNVGLIYSMLLHKKQFLRLHELILRQTGGRPKGAPKPKGAPPSPSGARPVPVPQQNQAPQQVIQKQPVQPIQDTQPQQQQQQPQQQHPDQHLQQGGAAPTPSTPSSQRAPGVPAGMHASPAMMSPRQREKGAPPTGWAQVPLFTVYRMIAVLEPEIKRRCAGATLSEPEVLDLLKTLTLVGLLPMPHPILVRKFESQQQTHAWVGTWKWGLVYLRNGSPPLLDSRSIRLFRIHMDDDDDETPRAIQVTASQPKPAAKPAPKPGAAPQQHQPHHHHHHQQPTDNGQEAQPHPQVEQQQPESTSAPQNPQHQQQEQKGQATGTQHKESQQSEGSQQATVPTISTEDPDTPPDTPPKAASTIAGGANWSPVLRMASSTPTISGLGLGEPLKADQPRRPRREPGGKF